MTRRPAFEWQKNVTVCYGKPFDEWLSIWCDELGIKRALIIASNSLCRSSDSLDRAKASLGNRVASTRVGVKPHSLWSEILEITELARKNDIDGLITLGGGSITDSSKIITLCLANGVSSVEGLEMLSQAAEKGKPDEIKGSEIPLICVPTSLSGGEYSAGAGGSDDRTHRKRSFAHPSMAPKVIILDPEITVYTPEWLFISSGVRAIDHCVETLCSLVSTDEVNVLAETALQRLVPGLIRCKQDPSAIEPRLECQLAVNQAMAPLQKKIPMGGSHAIGHQLGPFNVGHGQTSCILLPAVLKYNSSVNQGKQDHILQLLWSDEFVAKALLDAGCKCGVGDAGDCFDVLFGKVLGMPRSLSEVGVGREKFDQIAENSLKDRWAPTNPMPLKQKQQILQILELCA